MNCSETTDDEKSKAAWQKYHEARKAGNLERLLAVIDSMEQEEIVSPAKADHMRGLGYDAGWQMRIAEHYYKKAYEKYALNPSQDWDSYTDAGYRWAYLRFGRGDTEGALNVITGLLPQAKENKAFPKMLEAGLLMLMADCQIQLHQNDEARRNWQKAYEIQQSNKDNQAAVLPWISLSISASLFNMGDVEGAQEWLERAELEFPQYEQQGDSLIIEEWKGHFALWRARYLQATGHVAEAAATYAAVPRSYIMEPRGYMEAAEYLMDAGRYDEAAYWYEQMDHSYVATDGAQMTFENIASRLSPRYSAYRKAGRNGDAIVIADSISAAIDSALVWQKKNEASELSIIYQTHEKELALEESEAKTQREREEQQVVELLKSEPEEQLTPNQQLFRRICELMDSPERIYTDTDLDRLRLAQLLGTNEHYITDAISACANGKSVSGFLNDYRLRYASHLLTTTDNSVTLIAELSGFSRSSFFRVFSDAYGMSPSDYRKVVKK